MDYKSTFICKADILFISLPLQGAMLIRFSSVSHTESSEEKFVVWPAAERAKEGCLIYADAQNLFEIKRNQQ